MKSRNEFNNRDQYLEVFSLFKSNSYNIVIRIFHLNIEKCTINKI